MYYDFESRYRAIIVNCYLQESELINENLWQTYYVPDSIYQYVIKKEPNGYIKVFFEKMTGLLGETEAVEVFDNQGNYTNYEDR